MREKFIENTMLSFLTNPMTNKQILYKFFHIIKERKINMYQNEAIKLAEAILRLDELRDELYEELMKIMGSKGSELLRTLQNC